MKFQLKSRIFFLTLFIPLFSFSETFGEPNRFNINFFLPGVQLRYQDTAAQSRELVTHYSLNVNIEFQKVFKAGFEYVFFDETSGNQSFKIQRKLNEANILIHYKFFETRAQVSKNAPLVITLSPLLLIGQTFSDVNTQLLGISQSLNTSSRETVYGLGAEATFQIMHLLLELDMRAQSSKSYEPGTLFLGSLRIGFSVSL